MNPQPPVFWRTFKGELLNVYDMEPAHLLNCVALLDLQIERKRKLAELMTSIAKSKTAPGYGEGVALTMQASRTRAMHAWHRSIVRHTPAARFGRRVRRAIVEGLRAEAMS